MSKYLRIQTKSIMACQAFLYSMVTKSLALRVHMMVFFYRNYIFHVFGKFKKSSPVGWASPTNNKFHVSHWYWRYSGFPVENNRQPVTNRPGFGGQCPPYCE